MKKNKSASYQEYLIDTLKDPEEAAGYLSAALEGGDVRVFLFALHHVILAMCDIMHAHAGIKKKSLTNSIGQVRELTRKDIRAMRSAREVLLENLLNVLPKISRKGA